MVDHTELHSELLAFRWLVTASRVDMVHYQSLHSRRPYFRGHPGLVCEAGLTEIVPCDGVSHVLRRVFCPLINSPVPLNAQVAETKVIYNHPNDINFSSACVDEGTSPSK